MGHSINVQCVAGPHPRFKSMMDGFPGSTHDAFILRNSTLCGRFESGELSVGWLLEGFLKPADGSSDHFHGGEMDVFQGSGVCKWFNVRMGFGFLTMTMKEGVELDAPVDVFVHQSKLHMEGFRSLKEGEPVEFIFKKSSKGLESTRVTGPGGAPCLGSERRPKVKGQQKRKSKGDRCYNCGGLDHHAKECNLPPQPKKCHFCQSTNHMVAQCPEKAAQAVISQVKPATEETNPTVTE